MQKYRNSEIYYQLHCGLPDVLCPVLALHDKEVERIRRHAPVCCNNFPNFSPNYFHSPGQCKDDSPPDVVHAKHTEGPHRTPPLPCKGGGYTINTILGA